MKTKTLIRSVLPGLALGAAFLLVRPTTDVAGNALMAAHGGLYRTVQSPGDAVVLGRGEGYALTHNIKVGDLDRAIQTIRDRR